MTGKEIHHLFLFSSSLLSLFAPHLSLSPLTLFPLHSLTLSLSISPYFSLSSITYILHPHSHAHTHTHTLSLSLPPLYPYLLHYPQLTFSLSPSVLFLLLCARVFTFLFFHWGRSWCLY